MSDEPPSTPVAKPSSWPQEELWDGRTMDVEFRQYEPSCFPFTLYSCPVCAALVPDGEQWVHQEWHEAHPSRLDDPAPEEP